MIVWKEHNNSKEWLIYENEEEYGKSGIEYRDLRSNILDINKGDYVRTDNGYYVPVLSYSTAVNPKTKNIFIKVGYPNGRYKTTYYPDLGRVRKGVSFRFDRHIKYEPHKKLQPNEKLFAGLIIRGVGIYEAFHTVWRVTSKHELHKRLNKLLTNEYLLDYIKIKAQDMKLDETFADLGMDDEWFAGHIKNCIEDKKSAPTVKTKALDIVFAIKKAKSATASDSVAVKRIQPSDLKQVSSG